jgi:hypothetical protein
VSQVDRDGLINNLNKQNLYDMLDTNRSGKVTLEEFLEKALGQRDVANEARLFAAFLPEITEIDKVLRQRKKADLFQFFGTAGSTVSKATFGDAAGLLGFYPGTPRYMEFLRAFQDLEQPDMVDLRQVGLRSAGAEPRRPRARRPQQPLAEHAPAGRPRPPDPLLRLQPRAARGRRHGGEHPPDPALHPRAEPARARRPENVAPPHPGTGSTTRRCS